jgi:membrane protein required for colicin V production
MNSLDIGVLIILITFLARGIWIGLVRQLASLAALILGFVAAGRYYRQFGAVLESYLPSRLSFFITYALLFLLVYLAIIAIGFGLKKVMSISLLGWFDRLMGGLFGLSKAVILAAVLFLGLTGAVATTDPLLRQSVTAPYLTTVSQFPLAVIRDEKLQSQFLPRTPAISAVVPAAVPSVKPVGGDPQQKAKHNPQIPQRRP